MNPNAINLMQQNNGMSERVVRGPTGTSATIVQFVTSCHKTKLSQITRHKTKVELHVAKWLEDIPMRRTDSQPLTSFSVARSWEQNEVVSPESSGCEGKSIICHLPTDKHSTSTEPKHGPPMYVCINLPLNKLDLRV